MKKLCIAVGCLALMQTSAFSLTFNIGESIKEPTTVHVTERVLGIVKNDLGPGGTELYKPTITAEKVLVTWTVGKETVNCNTSSNRPIDQSIPLEQQFSKIMLIKSGTTGEYRCMNTPIKK